MPLIINELVVKGTIEAPPPESAPRPEGARAWTSGMAAEERAMMMAMIVEEVLRALDRMKER